MFIFFCFLVFDFDFFKEYLVVGVFGFMCVNVFKFLKMEEIVVFNLLIGKKKVLLFLIYWRNLVFLYVLVDFEIKMYKVIVVGSLSERDGGFLC